LIGSEFQEINEVESMETVFCSSITIPIATKISKKSNNSCDEWPTSANHVSDRLNLTGLKIGGQRKTMNSTPQGQQNEFSKLVHANYPIVVKVARSYSRTTTDCEDLIQEILFHMWQSFGKWDRSRKFSTWMYRIALNVAISYLRKTYRHSTVSLDDGELIGSQLAAGSPPETIAQARELRRVIEQLEPLPRALMILHLDSYSNQEISEILGISETNVSTKLNRLKKQLAQVFKAGESTSAETTLWK
jgi:RNA polymerase sigma-70 factor (ECF subfamily)